MNSSISKDKKSQNRILIIHIICWLIFIIYELGMIYSVLGKIEKSYIYLIYYPINISYFYSVVAILTYVFDPSKGRNFKGLIILLSSFIIYFAIKGLADYLLEDHLLPAKNSMVYFQGFFQRNFARGLYFTLLAIFYWSAGHISRYKKQADTAERSQLLVQKQNAELETALAKTESAYRQQQFNPHMLFNTLNFIYTNVQQHSEDAARCVWLLSEIMRFSLDATGNDGKVILESEAAQIENLLEINHYRFPYPIFIEVDMEGMFQLFRIIPLILITLTENVFKHGNLTEARNPAEIRLHVDDQGRLTFFTRNLKKAQTPQQRNREIGLQNVRIRLDAEYKDNYKLEINEPIDHFELKLTLTL